MYSLPFDYLLATYLVSRIPAAPRASVPRSTPQPTTRRSVSVRQTSQTESKQANPTRTSSMIVHDLEEENEGSEATISDEPLVQKPPLVPPPRTRKAKELQTRLGKGKPVIAGGSGPRAVTASSGSSKGRHSKSSKAVKPREPTIEEGE